MTARLGNTDTGRPVPHNIEVEQALLGAILLNNDAYYHVSNFLKPDHFYEGLHRVIFATASHMIREGKRATPVTIKTFLPADEKVGDLTVAQYLARLASEAVTIVNAEDYGRAIYDLRTRREIIALAEEMDATAHDAPLDMSPTEQIEAAEQRLYAMRDNEGSRPGWRLLADEAAEAAREVAEAMACAGGIAGLSTGLRSLDSRLGGLRPSDLIVLAGRPGMGKTALATNIAAAIACNGGRVGFFSLEMSGRQLALRILADRADVNASEARVGNVEVREYERINQTAQSLASVPFYIDETGGISIAQLSARAHRLKRRRGLDALIVDYIQLMQGSRRAGNNRVQEITEITTGLKSLAKDLGTPIIALSQLSRAVEGRTDKRPQLSDLRDSGSIEQDADTVLFVFREEYYLTGREPQEGTEEWLSWADRVRNAEGKAEVIIAKQRNGPTGTVALTFDAARSRFLDLVDDDRVPERRGG